MSPRVLLAGGYALLMWAAAWGLRRHAGSSSGTWISSETVAFARAMTLVPLAVGDAVVVGAALFERTRWALLFLTPIFLGITLSGWREVVWLRSVRRAADH